MKVKGLGRHIETTVAAGTEIQTYWNFRCLDKIVLGTEAIPFCVKQISGEGDGVVYFNKIGNCIKGTQGMFYFEAGLSMKNLQRTQELIKQGKQDIAFKFLQEHTRSYSEIS